MLTSSISILSIIIILFIAFNFILEYVLDSLNAKSWDMPIPKELEGIYGTKGNFEGTSKSGL